VTEMEDRHARFLTGIRPRLDNLAPLMVAENGHGFWAVLDPPTDEADPASGSCPKAPGWRRWGARSWPRYWPSCCPATTRPIGHRRPACRGRSTRPMITCS
jgi:hypothetical protein